MMRKIVISAFGPEIKIQPLLRMRNENGKTQDNVSRLIKYASVLGNRGQEIACWYQTFD